MTTTTTTCIDLFAGAGGFTTGAEMAGARVLWAANHWRSAVDAHAANHPNTEHACQDLQQTNFHAVPDHDILLASPACQGHSRARGKDRAHHDASRSTAWAVVAAVEAKQPAAFVVENVAEFARTWALYPTWRQALETYGYSITEQVIDAADLGVAQHRERLFVVGSRRGPISIETPTRRDQVAAREVLDFDGGTWSPIAQRRDGRPRAASTLRQIAAGQKVHGSRFLVAYYGSERHGRSLDRPLGTVTTRDRFVMVDTARDRLRPLTVCEYRRAMGFPDGYALAPSRKQSVHLLGNAVCPPVASHVVGQVMRAA